MSDETFKNPGAQAPTDRKVSAIGAPLRLLLVEDDELDRRAVRRCLQQCGISVIAEDASSAEETLQRIASNGYDCVLLDYYIPGVKGLALFQKIREVAA
ncbi:MAG TPA: response regulator, partial [Candidatus Binatia bacterium]